MNDRTRSAVTVAALALSLCASMVAAAGAVPATSVRPGAGAAPARPGAVQPGNHPTAVAGETNGDMSAGSLVTVEGRCRLARAAAPSLALLLATARADGVGLSPEDCYRPSARQARDRSRACGAGSCACAAGSGTSMHGWGKAVDFRDAGAGLRFADPGYRWLKANAARFGWNHPAWAEPGGSRCPEAWHWEWVGDGGTLRGQPVPADVVALLAPRSGHGYLGLSGLGAVVARGDAAGHGSAASGPIGSVVVGGAVRPDGAGYALLEADGTVLGFGAPAGPTCEPGQGERALSLAETPDGRGMWVLGADGAVTACGDAARLGDLTGAAIARPVAALAASPTGRGYWIVAGDGGVFAFGDARWVGSASGTVPPGDRVVGLAPTPTGSGYRLALASGRVEPFGDADLLGSDRLGSGGPAPVVAIADTPDGHGYWLVCADGAVIARGDAPDLGGARPTDATR